MNICIAGPALSQADRNFNDAVTDMCKRLKFTVLLQQADGTPEDMFAGDLRALEQTDVVVAVLDGMSIDPATAWKIGYAVARGKSVIGIQTDQRAPALGIHVIEQSTFIVRTLERLEILLRALDRS